MASESHWGADVLRPETAGAWEVNGEIGWKDGRFRASWYKTQFKDYTFLVDAAHDGGQRLPTKYWRSGDTQLHGVELEVNQWFDLNKYGTLEARLFGDFVQPRRFGRRAQQHIRQWQPCPQQRLLHAQYARIPLRRRPDME